jgi:hypothetical protein
MLAPYALTGGLALPPYVEGLRRLPCQIAIVQVDILHVRLRRGRESSSSSWDMCRGMFRPSGALSDTASLDAKAQGGEGSSLAEAQEPGDDSELRDANGAT